MLNKHVAWDQTSVYIHRNYKDRSKRSSDYKLFTAQSISKHRSTEYAENCLNDCTCYRNNSGMEDFISNEQTLIVMPCKLTWPKLDTTFKGIKTIVERNGNCVPERINCCNNNKSKNKEYNCIKNNIGLQYFLTQ